MSFNLIRNSRVVFTTNVAAGTGLVAGTGFTANNSQEIQVMDGFSFSQASNADTININEAGISPVRGQRSFNTSLSNVEFSFSTYIRPKLAGTVRAEESHMWNALLSANAIGTVAATFTTITAASITAGVLTLTGTGFSGGVAGEVVIIAGVTGVGASQFNKPVRITSASATSVVAQYIESPTVAIPAFGSWATATFNKTAWNFNAAVAADVTSTPGIPVAYSSVTTALSNRNQLLAFGMVITVDGITYVIDNCALDQAVIDFGLDGIAMVAWTGKGTALRQLATTVAYSTATDPVISGGLTGTVKGKDTTANFITNKLSTVTMISNVGGIGGTAYTLALTGGSITISNNITYVTPANLGVVNSPIGYFTGTRGISGTINAYLRTGSTNSSGLLNSLLAASATSAGIEPKFRLQLEIGGASNGTRIEVESSGAMLQIPTIDAQAVMSTAINFTCQGTNNNLADNAYDITNVNELAIRYFSI